MFPLQRERPPALAYPTSIADRARDYDQRFQGSTAVTGGAAATPRLQLFNPVDSVFLLVTEQLRAGTGGSETIQAVKSRVRLANLVQNVDIISGGLGPGVGELRSEDGALPAGRLILFEPRVVGHYNAVVEQELELEPGWGVTFVNTTNASTLILTVVGRQLRRTGF